MIATIAVLAIAIYSLGRLILRREDAAIIARRLAHEEADRRSDRWGRYS